MTQTQTAAALDVHEVLNALEAWINKCPGLDPRDYGLGDCRTIAEWKEARSSYNREARSIAKDKREALAALAEARACDPNPEALQEAFGAFSGRLEWVTDGHAFITTQDGAMCACGRWEAAIVGSDANQERARYNYALHLEAYKAKPAHLSYTTGQYWPTEYRKAARAVLESYVSKCQASSFKLQPRAFTYHNLADVRAANKAKGGHWFDRSNMQFFNSKIESDLIGGRFFVTSERMDLDREKLYSVREAKPDGDIDTVGKFQQYGTRAEALGAAREVATK